MTRVVFGVLSAFALLLPVSVLSGMGAAQAQGSGEDLIPVCVEYFESTPGVEYLTQAQIEEIEAAWAAYDGMDILQKGLPDTPIPSPGPVQPRAASPLTMILSSTRSCV